MVPLLANGCKRTFLTKSLEQANQNHEVQIDVSFGKWSLYWQMANETVAETLVEKWDLSMFGGWKCEMDIAAADCAKCGMYLVRWCFESIKFLSCLNVSGGDSFSMACAFHVNGVVPSLSMWYPTRAMQLFACELTLVFLYCEVVEVFATCFCEHPLMLLF